MEKCPNCGSDIIKNSNSLTTWKIKYACGREIYGHQFGNKGYDVLTPCPEKKEVEIEEKALRYNEGKLKWGLVNFNSLKPLVKVLMFGANKYSPNNWMKNMSLKEIEESSFRHLTAIMDGEMYDKESGELHIGHLMCNAMFWNYHYNKLNENKEKSKEIS